MSNKRIGFTDDWRFTWRAKHIAPIEIIKETPKTYHIRDGLYGISVLRKTSINIFPTFQEAKLHLIDTLSANISRGEKDLKKQKNCLEEVRQLTE